MTRRKKKNSANANANSNVHSFTVAVFRRFSLSFSFSHFRAACVCVLSGFKPRAVQRITRDARSGLRGELASGWAPGRGSAAAYRDSSGSTGPRGRRRTSKARSLINPRPPRARDCACMRDCCPDCRVIVNCR